MDGKLDFEEVDEKYAISFVFKGNWKAKLEGPGCSVLHPDGGGLEKKTVLDDFGDEETKVCGYFSGLTLDEQYVIVIRYDTTRHDTISYA